MADKVVKRAMYKSSAKGSGIPGVLTLVILPKHYNQCTYTVNVVKIN